MWIKGKLPSGALASVIALSITALMTMTGMHVLGTASFTPASPSRTVVAGGDPGSGAGPEVVRVRGI